MMLQVGDVCHSRDDHCSSPVQSELWDARSPQQSQWGRGQSSGDAATTTAYILPASLHHTGQFYKTNPPHQLMISKIFLQLEIFSWAEIW